MGSGLDNEISNNGYLNGASSTITSLFELMLSKCPTTAKEDLSEDNDDIDEEHLDYFNQKYLNDANRSRRPTKTAFWEKLDSEIKRIAATQKTKILRVKSCVRQKSSPTFLSVMEDLSEERQRSMDSSRNLSPLDGYAIGFEESSKIIPSAISNTDNLMNVAAESRENAETPVIHRTNTGTNDNNISNSAVESEKLSEIRLSANTNELLSVDSEKQHPNVSFEAASSEYDGDRDNFSVNVIDNCSKISAIQNFITQTSLSNDKAAPSEPATTKATRERKCSRQRNPDLMQETLESTGSTMEPDNKSKTFQNEKLESHEQNGLQQQFEQLSLQQQWKESNFTLTNRGDKNSLNTSFRREIHRQIGITNESVKRQTSCRLATSRCRISKMSQNENNLTSGRATIKSSISKISQKGNVSTTSTENQKKEINTIGDKSEAKIASNEKSNEQQNHFQLRRPKQRSHSVMSFRSGIVISDHHHHDYRTHYLNHTNRRSQNHGYEKNYANNPLKNSTTIDYIHNQLNHSHSNTANRHSHQHREHYVVVARPGCHHHHHHHDHDHHHHHNPQDSGYVMHSGHKSVKLSHNFDLHTLDDTVSVINHKGEHNAKTHALNRSDTQTSTIHKFDDSVAVPNHQGEYPVETSNRRARQELELAARRRTLYERYLTSPEAWADGLTSSSKDRLRAMQLKRFSACHGKRRVSTTPPVGRTLLMTSRYNSATSYNRMMSSMTSPVDVVWECSDSESEDSYC